MTAHNADTERCQFCAIVRGTAPATMLQEWDDAILIEPLNPVVRGHVLVIPKRHVQTFFSDPPQDKAASMGWSRAHSAPPGTSTGLRPTSGTLEHEDRVPDLLRDGGK